MSKESDEMKYEGLAALIVTLDEKNEKRFVDKRFTGLEKHNRNQNGAISKARDDIDDVKKEMDKRELTCMASVDSMQKNVKYVRVIEWIGKRWKLTLFGFIGILLITNYIVDRGWMGKLFEIIKEIR